MSRYVNLSDEAMIETLARDNEALSKENIRLNQVVDAFCKLTGNLPQYQSIELPQCIISGNDPKALREIANMVRKAQERMS